MSEHSHSEGVLQHQRRLVQVRVQSWTCGVQQRGLVQVRVQSWTWGLSRWSFCDADAALTVIVIYV